MRDPIEESGTLAEAIDWWNLEYDELDEQLVCPICRTALVDPYCTDCGHTFCKECILATNRMALEDERPTRCPIDRKPVLQEPQPAPLIVRSMLDSLNVRCPFASRGCHFRGERWLLESHVSSDCEYARVTCHAPCERTVERARFGSQCKCSDSESECADDEASEVTSADDAPWRCPGEELGCCWQPPSDAAADTDACARHVQGCALALIAPTLRTHSAKLEAVQLENRALKRQLESAARQANRNASDLDSQILNEYERLWGEIKDAAASNASQQQLMIKLTMENARMSEDLSFLRSALDSMRRQMQLMSLSHRRLSLYSSFSDHSGALHEAVDLADASSSVADETSRQRRSAQKL